jgi:VanZ family protein
VKRRIWLAAFGALLAANIAFIWGNSMLPGEVSQQVSGGAMGWFGFLVASFGKFGEKVLRKIAHLAEFASLGFLLTGFFRLLKKHGITVPLLCGLMVACVDETIQICSPGRASSLVDVWIDMGGLVCGIILLLTGQFILRKTIWRKQK